MYHLHRLGFLEQKTTSEFVDSHSLDQASYSEEGHLMQSFGLQNLRIGVLQDNR